MTSHPVRTLPVSASMRADRKTGAARDLPMRCAPFFSAGAKVFMPAVVLLAVPVGAAPGRGQAPAGHLPGQAHV